MFRLFIDSPNTKKEVAAWAIVVGALCVSTFWLGIVISRGRK